MINLEKTHELLMRAYRARRAYMLADPKKDIRHWAHCQAEMQTAIRELWKYCKEIDDEENHSN